MSAVPGQASMPMAPSNASTRLQQRRARYEKELETYKKDGKGSSQTITDNIKNVELEIAAQEELLATKRGEIPTINAKYDEDKKRYTVATSGKK